MSGLDAYLDAVERAARGPGAARLAVELRDHVADALADELRLGGDPDEAAGLVLARLGSPADALAAWDSHVRRTRTRTRRRAAVVALLAASATALAVVQLAAGHRPEQGPCPAPDAAARCAHHPTR